MNLQMMFYKFIINLKKVIQKSIRNIKKNTLEISK